MMYQTLLFGQEKTGIFHNPSKPFRKELSFNTASFENIKDDLAYGIVFHPQDESFNLCGLKRYKMYRVKIEEI